MLDVRNLAVKLATLAGWVAPVNDVSLHIAPGEAGLVGESGSGKTMLSLALMGLLPEGARVSGEAFLGKTGARAGNDGGAAEQRICLTSLDEPGWWAESRA